MKYANNDPGRYRFERKFVVTDLQKAELESQLRFHPAMFSEIYQERRVNNIYFDSSSMTNYYANVDGLQQRTKCRVRWYGKLMGEVKKPVLELKIKDGLMGRKESYRLLPFSIDQDFDTEVIYEIFRKSKIPQMLVEDLMGLQPALLNRYTRKYFQSADANYRVTLDSELQYYRIDPHNNTFLNNWTDERTIVLELKYNHDNDQLAADVSSYFPFRMTKSSKYVNGIQKLYLF